MTSSHTAAAPCRGAVQIGSIGLHLSAPQTCYIMDFCLLFTTELQDLSNISDPASVRSY